MAVATGTCAPIRRVDSVRVVPRPATGKTFIARVRIAWKKWLAFGFLAESQGTDRSKLINEYLDWYMRDRRTPLDRPDKAAIEAAKARADAESP